MDLAFNILLKSPVLKYYAFDTYFNKKTVNNSNQLLAGFSYNENHDESRVSSIRCSRNF